MSNRIHPYFVQTSRAVAASSEGRVYTGDLPNGPWVDGAHLHPGDRLLNDDASWAEVVAVGVEARPLTAHNLTVIDVHTCFVAAPGRVHNTNTPTPRHPETVRPQSLSLQVPLTPRRGLPWATDGASVVRLAWTAGMG